MWAMHGIFRFDQDVRNRRSVGKNRKIAENQYAAAAAATAYSCLSLYLIFNSFVNIYI